MATDKSNEDEDIKRFVSNVNNVMKHGITNGPMMRPGYSKHHMMRIFTGTMERSGRWERILIHAGKM